MVVVKIKGVNFIKFALRMVPGESLELRSFETGLGDRKTPYLKRKINYLQEK